MIPGTIQDPWKRRSGSSQRGLGASGPQGGYVPLPPVPLPWALPRFQKALLSLVPVRGTWLCLCVAAWLWGLGTMQGSGKVGVLVPDPPCSPRSLAAAPATTTGRGRSQ